MVDWWQGKTTVMRKILPPDIKRLRRDNPQRALFENVERGVDSAQVKIKADI